jgi:hypothetical protein
MKRKRTVRVNRPPEITSNRMAYIKELCENGIRLTFLNVLNPARIEPPIHVLYLRSGGANILIFISLTARRFTSERSRSPNPVQSFLRHGQLREHKVRTQFAVNKHHRFCHEAASNGDPRTSQKRTSGEGGAPRQNNVTE